MFGVIPVAVLQVRPPLVDTCTEPSATRMCREFFGSTTIVEAVVKGQPVAAKFNPQFVLT